MENPTKPTPPKYDAVIVGSGPNGLAAAVRLAQENWNVLVVEKHNSLGGGTRTEELTLPGFRHDVCSAIHPMGLCSPFFDRLPLDQQGLEWIHPEIPLAHPFDDGSAAIMLQSVRETAAGFQSSGDEQMYRLVFEPLVKHSSRIFSDLLAPPRIPAHPFSVAQMGVRSIPSALAAARAWFSGEPARALLAGNAAHSVLPLDRSISTNAVGLMLMLAGHAKGWPIAKGGSVSIPNALASLFQELGGEILTGWEVGHIEELPKARSYLFDTTPSALAKIAGERLPEKYRKRLQRFRHGPGIFKIDYALSSPVPWKAEECTRAGTVHLGGCLDEIVSSERDCWNGFHSEKPFVLTAQQSLFDPTRAPAGKHTFWAYCHTSPHSDRDMTEVIENQIERFAPGFRDCVEARHTRNCLEWEAYNPNLIGGDITGGANDWRQLLARPVTSLHPHSTPANDIFLCSSSTPPGGGVHGMCGYWAAEEALRTIH